ncbi:hypothetical protein HYZ82_00965 [Candidatus Nomurabacteria bacterium]|nr:hypothetical protein [Candidatus Nomurabacteria bacterium]
MSTKTRLSLDLPSGHHDMMEQTLEICGFSSKTEAMKVMIETYLELALMAQEGKMPAGLHHETKEVTPLYGSLLCSIARGNNKKP